MKSDGTVEYTWREAWPWCSPFSRPLRKGCPLSALPSPGASAPTGLPLSVLPLPRNTLTLCPEQKMVVGVRRVRVGMCPAASWRGAWKQVSCPGSTVPQTIWWAIVHLHIPLWRLQYAPSVGWNGGTLERGHAKAQSVSVVAGRRGNLTFMGCLYTELWEKIPRVYESLCSESPHVPEGTRPKLPKAALPGRLTFFHRKLFKIGTFTGHYYWEVTDDRLLNYLNTDNGNCEPHIWILKRMTLIFLFLI